MDTKNHLIKQIKVALDQLENKYYDETKNGVLQLIYKRYTNALEVLENNKNINEINIIGSVRAYLDSYSDYENPLLEDLYHVEKLYRKLLEDA